MQKSTLISSTGASLNLYTSIPKKSPKAIVHITHGMAEHAARYEWFSDILMLDNIAVFAHDLRGHGFTTATDSQQGVFASKDGLSKVIKDHDYVLEHISQKFPQIPIFGVGHSLGSILLLNYAIINPTKMAGLACWNSGIETNALARLGKFILSVESFFRDGRSKSLIAWKLTFERWNAKFKPNRTDFDWLSRDEDQVDAYIADPMCGFDVSLSCWRDTADAVFYASRNLHKIPKNLPIFLLGGAEDACTNGGSDMLRLQKKLIALGHEQVKCKILEEARHESLNELNREETSKILLNWINDCVQVDT